MGQGLQMGRKDSKGTSEEDTGVPKCRGWRAGPAWGCPAGRAEGQGGGKAEIKMPRRFQTCAVDKWKSRSLEMCLWKVVF